MTLEEVVKAILNVSPEAIPIIALLLVIYWQFKFINKFVDGQKKSNEAINKLITLIEVMLGRGNS